MGLLAEQLQQQAQQQREVHRQARRSLQQPLVPQLQLQQQRLRQQHLVQQLPQRQLPQLQLVMLLILVQNLQVLIPTDAIQVTAGLIVVVKARVVSMLHWAELVQFQSVIC